VNALAALVQIAFGSASECEYQLLLARDLHYIPATEHRKLETQVVELKRMLASLLRTLNQKAAVRGKS
jgi:four helix bundle protein